MLKSHGIAKATKRDCKILKEVCSMVSTRAARLSAAGVAAIALHQKRTNDCTVAVDGTVFLKYPHFKDRMMGALREMLGKNMGVRFTTTSDGSGIGAAIAAATTVA
jgi:hexokinase